METEVFSKTMKRKLIMLVLALLLLSALPVLSGAEGASPATPTDLACPHTQTRTVIYFFDSPAYTALSPEIHRVAGPATVEVTCLTCGALLSSETVNNAEEIRPHSMIRGVCPLCGYRENVHTDRKAPAEGGGPQEEADIYTEEETDD